MSAAAALPVGHRPPLAMYARHRSPSRIALCRVWHLALAATCFMQAGTAHAQLRWGSIGSGGTGAWNTTSANWWNGTSNVVWPGGTAVFGGTPGTVTPFGFSVRADQLIFEVPGYTLSDGRIEGAANLIITANEDATIQSGLTSSAFNSTLTKNGTGTLTVSGSVSAFDSLRIEAGELRVSGDSNLSFTDVIFGSSSGTTLTLAPTEAATDVGSLSGGGGVRPDAQARTVTARISQDSTFAGRLQDNGDGRLAPIFSGYGGVLTGANSYTGATEVTGSLSFAGGGSARFSSAIRIANTGLLLLDNLNAASPDRLSDSAEVQIEGGKLTLQGKLRCPGGGAAWRAEILRFGRRASHASRECGDGFAICRSSEEWARHAQRERQWACHMERHPARRWGAGGALDYRGQ